MWRVSVFHYAIPLNFKNGSIQRSPFRRAASVVHYKVFKKYQREAVREGWTEGRHPSEAG